MFWQRRDHRAARVDQWKWIKLGDQPAKLFDLAGDIDESNDLAAERPEVLQRLESEFQHWTASMDAAEPRGPFRDF